MGTKLVEEIALGIVSGFIAGYLLKWWQSRPQVSNSGGGSF